MRLVAKNIETYPLYGMKNNQTQSKTKIVYYRNWIRNKLFHDLNIESKNMKYKTKLKKHLIIITALCLCPYNRLRYLIRILFYIMFYALLIHYPCFINVLSMFYQWSKHASDPSLTRPKITIQVSK